MQRTAIALAVAGLALAGTGIASAGPGNGAQRSGITAASGLSALACSAASSDQAGTRGTHGFVVLNAPGRPAKAAKNGKAARPDGTHKLVGQVALQNAQESTVYDVRVADSEGSCGGSVGTLVTDRQGNGRLSFEDKDLRAGRYHVVLVERPLSDAPVVGELVQQQRFASAPVTVR